MPRFAPVAWNGQHLWRAVTFAYGLRTGNGYDLVFQRNSPVLIWRGQRVQLRHGCLAFHSCVSVCAVRARLTVAVLGMCSLDHDEYCLLFSLGTIVDVGV